LNIFIKFLLPVLCGPLQALWPPVAAGVAGPKHGTDSMDRLPMSSTELRRNNRQLSNIRKAWIQRLVAGFHHTNVRSGPVRRENSFTISYCGVMPAASDVQLPARPCDNYTVMAPDSGSK